MPHPLITIIGPTAIGKSDLAVHIALYIQKKYGKTVEIISADSRQVYKHLDIGTGKITQEEMRGIKHHMLDVTEPTENYSVFRYGKDVEKILTDIYARGCIPILCGGTGFYIDAVIYGNIGAETSANIEFQNELEKFSITELTEKLTSLAEKNKINISHVDLKNKRRIIRAIDILTQDGKFAIKNTVSPYKLLQIGLDTETQKLQTRIRVRIEKRIEQGMIVESEKLLEKRIITHERMNKLGLEYRYISHLLLGTYTLTEFTEKLFYAVWHYAKRQRTWFKRYKDIQWFDAEEVKKDASNVERLVDQFSK